MVLGHSRYLWARFVEHQDLQTLLRCHIAAFEHLGGVVREILYDQMKSAVLGEAEDQHIVYNRSLVALAQHYGFSPRACKPYRAKTKGKVERPYRYIRQDFFLARRFRNLEDLNAQLRGWLDTVANTRVHGTTQRVVAEHFAQEQPALQCLPAGAFNAVLRLERRVSHDGMVSVGGNLYSVPDRTRRRVLEVHSLADEVHIYEGDQLIASHPLLEGHRQRSLLPGHRRFLRPSQAPWARRDNRILQADGHAVARRSLTFYAAVGERLRSAGAAHERQCQHARLIIGSNSPSPAGLEDAARPGGARTYATAYRAGRDLRAGGDRCAAGQDSPHARPGVSRWR